MRGINHRSPRNNKKIGVKKQRCSKCRKLAKDFIAGKPLCRVHSPEREGFKI